MKKILLILTLIWIYGSISAQNSSMQLIGKPSNFNQPLDYSFSGTPAQVYNYVYSTDLKPDKQTPWLVINDRAGNIAYKTASVASGAKSTLDFLESYYVVDYKEEWLHIIRIDGKTPISLSIPASASVMDMGWVKRENMLIWREGLVNKESGISLKCLLLNKAEDIKRITSLANKEIVRIYDSPTGLTTVGDRKIYEIFYILKKENSRVLIAKDYIVGQNPKSLILGWVDDNRLSRWNTRIAIEPNNTEAAFNERLANPKNRFIFFGQVPDVNNYIKTGTMNNVLFDEDPVKIDPERLAKSNRRRYKGGVLRYPILDNYQNYFGTGVIGKVTTRTAAGALGEMSTIALADLEETMRISREEDKKVNVYFMIESSTEVNMYKNTIVNVMNDMPTYFPQANYINYGCAIYGDSEPGQTPIINKPLSQNRKDIISFVSNSTLHRPQDADKYTTFRYALNKVLKDGGWNPRQRNLIIVIGNGADFSANSIRAGLEANSQYYVDDDAMGGIYKAISALGMNMLIFQIKNENSRHSRKFRDDCAEMLNEAAKSIGNEYKPMADKFQFNYVEPAGPVCVADKFTTVTPSVNYSGIFIPSQGGFLSEQRFGLALNKAVEDFTKFRDRQMNEMSNLIEKGNSLDVTPGEFQPFLMHTINTQLKGIDQNTLKQFFNAKYQLFNKAYLPKQVVGSKYPLYSYVLFMPGEELKEFKNNKLKELTQALGRGSSAAQLRESLKEALIDLVLDLSAQKGRASAGDVDMDEALRIITGLNTEGVSIFKNYKNKKLGDLDKRSVWTDEDIMELSEQLSRMKEKLDEIYRLGSNYEFSFQRDGDKENIYFWIALNEIFGKEMFE